MPSGPIGNDDDSFNIPSPDFGYFGSQENVGSNTFDIDDILDSRNITESSELQLSNILSELKSIVDEGINEVNQDK